MASVSKMCVGTFYKNICKQQIKRNLGDKTQLKEKEINFMLSDKIMMIHFIVE